LAHPGEARRVSWTDGIKCT